MLQGVESLGGKSCSELFPRLQPVVAVPHRCLFLLTAQSSMLSYVPAVAQIMASRSAHAKEREREEMEGEENGEREGKEGAERRSRLHV